MAWTDPVAYPNALEQSDPEGALNTYVIDNLNYLKNNNTVNPFPNGSFSIGFPNSTVNAVVADPVRNKVYIGGSFQYINGVSYGSVACWDGTSWSNLSNTGTTNTITDMALDSSGNLYVCGTLNNIGGVVAGGVAKWDGTSWSRFGNANQSIPTTVKTIAISPSGVVYVGGAFTQITVNGSNVSCPRVARFNGTTWESITAGAGPNNDVNAMAFDSSGNLYLVGNFTTVDALTSNNGVVKYNGSVYQQIGTGPGNSYSVAVSPQDSIYITSNTGGGLFKWNGSTWATLGIGITGVALSSSMTNGIIAVSDTEIYVGSSTGFSGGVPLGGIAKWNGTSWSQATQAYVALSGNPGSIAKLGDTIYASAGGSGFAVDRTTGASAPITNLYKAKIV